METQVPRPISECAERIGVSLSTAKNHWTAISRKLGRNPADGLVKDGPRPSKEVQQITDLARAAPETMQELLQEKARLLLEEIDLAKAKRASVGELSRGAEALLKTRNLILGEPTQILRVEDRQNLGQIIAKLAEEAQKRGYEVAGGELVHSSRVIEAQVGDDAAGD